MDFYRTSKVLESTSLGRTMHFNITETYNVYEDGTTTLFSKDYIKQDYRECINIIEHNRYYASEKGYRLAIKRWSKELNINTVNI
tara:strand:+ start:4220 stop:4474 length:255 start_codon:yes stop_codon:yes gene_type:complete